MAFFKNL